MSSLRILALLAVASLSFSCASPGTRNPYQYAEGKPGGAKTVSAASMDGRFIFLSDGSIWNVDWADARTAARLRAGEAVTVGRGGSSEFPYEIIPTQGPSVSARLGKKLD